MVDTEARRLVEIGEQHAQEASRTLSGPSPDTLAAAQSTANVVASHAMWCDEIAAMSSRMPDARLARRINVAACAAQSALELAEAYVDDLRH